MYNELREYRDKQARETIMRIEAEKRDRLIRDGIRALIERERNGNVSAFVS